jgi:Leucine-rich repeat (LRR) protein
MNLMKIIIINIIWIILSIILIGCSKDRPGFAGGISNDLQDSSDFNGQDSSGLIEIIPGMSVYELSGRLSGSDFTQNPLYSNDYSKILKSNADLGRIRVINFRKSGLAKLPEAVSELKNLVSIDLSENPQLDFEDAFLKLSKLKNLKDIHLSENNFITLPGNINLLQATESLDLSQNIDLRLDDAFGKLSRLRRLIALDLSNNVFFEIPVSLAFLKNLQKIDLGYNWLQSIPTAVFKLTNLKELFLRGNEIKLVPDEIAFLKSLTTIDIGFNKLVFISDSLFKLSVLNTVMLDGNTALDYNYFCNRLANIYSIKHLSLAKNWLQSVPYSIGEMQNLEVLNLSNNYISSLPPGIYNLRKLKFLDISGNKIRYINKESFKKNFTRTLINNQGVDSDTLLDLVF